MTLFAIRRASASRPAGRFLADDRGATAVEYGLMTALISVAIMATIFFMGESIKTALIAIVTALAAM